LGDVSRLFRPAASGEATTAGASRGTTPPGATPARAPRTNGARLATRTLLSRDELAALLKEFVGALEEGLTAIDSALPCPPCGEIDLLGLSPAHQLTIIDFDTTGGEALLLRGLGHHDWVTRSLPILRRLYSERPIDYSLPPALMLVAPQFSPPLKCAARQVTRPIIKWVRYCAHESSAGLEILFERLQGSD
jgi:hypothetical protein